nr:rhomboid family intramembrane serine protease [Heyndrickxia coagulans]
MNSRADVLFWAISRHFVVEQEYRILFLSENRDEMWLANTKKKNLPLVRLLRYDIDWGNWLYRDIRDCCAQAEDLCKQIKRLAPRVLNIYVSEYAPVDDYEIYLDEPMHINGGKTELRSVLIEGENPGPGISKLRPFTESRLAIAPETMSWDAYALQRTVFEAEARREEEERQLFDAGRPFFTYVFLAVQIAVFIVMSLTGGTQNTQNLIRFGAKYNPLIMEGQYWRLIMPVFIHIGIMHLFMNSLSLYYIGPLVERIYGKARFALIYLFAGFTGCLASFLFSPSLSAGASGAIFGLFGALLYIGTAYRDLFFRTMGPSVITLIIINLVFGFSVSGIDNFGHLGGLFGGFLAACIVHFPKRKRIGVQLTALLIAAFLVYMGLRGIHPAD